MSIDKATEKLNEKIELLKQYQEAKEFENPRVKYHVDYTHSFSQDYFFLFRKGESKPICDGSMSVVLNYLKLRNVNPYADEVFVSRKGEKMWYRSRKFKSEK